jgi:hypothetical protein
MAREPGQTFPNGNDAWPMRDKSPFPGRDDTTGGDLRLPPVKNTDTTPSDNMDE